MGDSASSSSSSSSSPTRLSSLHKSLGTGSVADLLLWRNRTGAVILLVSSTGFWFLFERAGYNLLSFVSTVLLLLVAILFLWAKSATLLNRPLPPVPNMEIPEEFSIRAADDILVLINHVLSIASDITIARNPTRLLQVSFVLWAISYVGTLINSLTLVYIVILLSLSVPVVYENFQEHIDDKLNSTSKVIRNISRKFPMAVSKEKKYQ
ncbi:hypothetical protein Bca52824_019042 [Brassica carinata]|uniref:Reticulon-like protein n=1 Tax=Brassica carinata TaxID=52824 RepID=A0A8X7VR87_BRACI|nr:hypothetical protein Bca52824_019042 [Brassica carinata]